MSESPPLHRPRLASFVRYRWDTVRSQHQLVFPEGMLVLNETGAAVVQQCDGRTLEEIVGALENQFQESGLADEVCEFMNRLAKRGFVQDADDA